MSETRQRRFGLLDLMIMIAGTAFCFWIAPEGLSPIVSRAVEFVRQNWRSWQAVQRFGLLLIRCQPIAAVLTLTILTLASRRSQSYRDLANHPGSMACLAAILAIFLVAPFSYATSRINFSNEIPILVRLQVRIGEALIFQRAEGGVAVATAWVALAIGGRWFRRGDAIDWAGRLIGIYWIATLPLTWLCLLKG